MKRTPLRQNTDHSWSRDGPHYWSCGNRGCTASEFSPDGEPDVGYACEGGLKKSGGPDRSSRPRPVAKGGPKNRRDPETGVKHTYGPCFEWISKNLPCCVCGTLDGAPADHWKTVKTGGKDPGNCLPLCRSHQGRHDMGPKTWTTVHRVDPTEVAIEAWRAFVRAEPEMAEKMEDHLPRRAA